MNASERNEYQPSVVSLPGSTLEEVLEERGMSQAELAQRMGRPKKTINEIVKGLAAITPDTAIQLERVLGIPATFWNARQRLYDEARARSDSVEKLSSAGTWQELFPYAEMAKQGWIPTGLKGVSRTEALLRFFGINSPEEWEAVYGAKRLGVAFRRSEAFDADQNALAAWLRQGELEASTLATSPYGRKAFEDALRTVRSLIRELPDEFDREMQQMCAAAGVSVVFVPLIKRVHASGATRWLSPGKAMLLLSLRGKREDIFWFSFFHEAAHILLHGKRDFFVEYGGDARKGAEQEADAFARDFLIRPEAWAAFIGSATTFTAASVEDFAREVDTAPGVVVGRLQHEKLISHAELNDLCRSIRFSGEERG